jgi:cardiolipin synthase
MWETMTNQDDRVTGYTASSAPVGPAEPQVGDRIVTIPNGISAARLVGVPVFLWLVLGLRTTAGDWWAVGLLIASSASDWLDGKIARALNQQSRLGQLLDPAADRLYILATIIALAVRAIIPWWLVGLLAARELMMAGVLAVLRRHGWGALQVSFVGKTATWCLLYAFPLLFLGSHVRESYAETARVAGWSFAIWGSALYWCAAVLYLVQARRLIAGEYDNDGADGGGKETGPA